MNAKFVENILFRARTRLWGSHYRRHILNHRRILHDYRCIYIHIPKTGGDSIAEALYTLPKRTDRTVPSLPKHAKAAEVKRALGDAVWEEYFSFAFVRNPWDLMVSSYQWWLQKAPIYTRLRDPDVRNIKRMGSFTEFVRSRYGRTMINEYEGEMFDWISERGEIIVDFVGRFERLDEDWKEICARIGVGPVALPHVNRTERKPYREYYTEETRHIVAERFGRTIERFGYEF